MALTLIASRARADSRQYVRVVPRPGQPVRVDINGTDFIEILHATDISEGGLGIRVPYGFNGCRIDEVVSFVLELPMKKRAVLHLSGKIKHVSGDRFGVRFLNVPEEARCVVRRYIAQCLWEKSFFVWLKYRWDLLLNRP